MCWANFFAHRTQKHGDVETNNTTAHPQQGTTETRITSAPEKHTKNTHFSPAKAMAVSDNRATWSAEPNHSARERRRHHRQPNLARNLSRSFFETPQKRCNSNATNSTFELVEGELRAKLLVGNRSWDSGQRIEPTHEARASTPGPTGVEGAGETCRGTGGWRRGLAGLRADAPSRTSATKTPLV